MAAWERAGQSWGRSSGKGGCEKRSGSVVLSAGRGAAAHGGGTGASAQLPGDPSHETPMGMPGHQPNPAPDAVLGGSCHGEKSTVPGEQGKPKQKQCVAARQLCAKEMSKDPTGLTNGFHRVLLSLTRSSLC